MLCNKRSCCNEKPMHRNERVVLTPAQRPWAIMSFLWDLVSLNDL